MESKNHRTLVERNLKGHFLLVVAACLLSCFGYILVVLEGSYGRSVKKAVDEEKKVVVDIVS